MAAYRPIYTNPIISSNEISVALPQSSTVVGKQRRHHHPATDWENIKPTVIRLYIEERRRVEDVIGILESDFDFPTGRRQLYIKLQEWKICKNKNRRKRDIRSATRSVIGRQRDSLSPAILSSAYLNPSTLLQGWSDSSLSTPDPMVVDSLPNDHHTPQWHHSSHSNTNDLMPRSPTQIAIRTRSPSPISRRPYDPVLFENQESLGHSPQVLQGTNILVANSRDQLDSNLTSALEKIVSHLLESATNRMGVVYHSDAPLLKEDLKRFLDLSRTIETLPENCVRSRGRSSLGEELNIVCELFTSARRMGFNVAISSPYNIVPSNQIIWKRKQKELRIGTGVVTIMAKSGKYVDCVQHSERFEGRQRLLSAKIRAKLDHSTQAFEIEVNEWELPDGSFSSIPRITVHNIIPYGSPVFDIARSGRVEDLVALFSNGQASLHDRDQRGRSLLYYSLRNPEMCRFLAQKGLDVDEPIASEYYVDGHRLEYSTPLHECLVKTWNLEVAQILLSEGADPTISLVGADSVATTMPNILSLHYHEIMRLTLHLNIVVEFAIGKDIFGQTIFLNACHLRYYLELGYYFISPEMYIQFLIDEGRRIRHRSHGGSNCLTSFFRSDFRELLNHDCLDALIDYHGWPGVDFFDPDITESILYADSTFMNWTCVYDLVSFDPDDL